MNDNFKTALNTFIAGCEAKKIANTRSIFDANHPALERELEKDKLEIREGKKYCKIVENNGGSVYCFVCKETGNVLKSASWNAPAKHARGNIFDEHNGLKYMSAYGAAYLK